MKRGTGGFFGAEYVSMLEVTTEWLVGFWISLGGGWRRTYAF